MSDEYDKGYEDGLKDAISFFWSLDKGCRNVMKRAIIDKLDEEINDKE